MLFRSAVGTDSRVSQIKVQLGRRDGDRYEVVSGLKGGEQLVAEGASFLADGDLVRVLQPGKSAPAPAPQAAKK